MDTIARNYTGNVKQIRLRGNGTYENSKYYGRCQSWTRRCSCRCERRLGVATDLVTTLPINWHPEPATHTDQRVRQVEQSRVESSRIVAKLIEEGGRKQPARRWSYQVKFTLLVRRRVLSGNEEQMCVLRHDFSFSDPPTFANSLSLDTISIPGRFDYARIHGGFVEAEASTARSCVTQSLRTVNVN